MPKRPTPDGATEQSMEPPAPGEVNLKMRMGMDMRYHFEDPELRKRGGDAEDVEWMEFDPEVLLRPELDALYYG